MTGLKGLCFFFMFFFHLRLQRALTLPSLSLSQLLLSLFPFPSFNHRFPLFFFLFSKSSLFLNLLFSSSYKTFIKYIFHNKAFGNFMITKWSVSSSKRNPNQLQNCRTRTKRRVRRRNGHQTLLALYLLPGVWRICIERKSKASEFSLFKNLEMLPMVLIGCLRSEKGVLGVFIKDPLYPQVDKVIQL